MVLGVKDLLSAFAVVQFEDSAIGFSYEEVSYAPVTVSNRIENTNHQTAGFSCRKNKPVNVAGRIDGTPGGVSRKRYEVSIHLGCAQG